MIELIAVLNKTLDKKVEEMNKAHKKLQDDIMIVDHAFALPNHGTIPTPTREDLRYDLCSLRHNAGIVKTLSGQLLAVRKLQGY